MKINEVEALVGITKKNIRFYEQEGLLSPRRNSENGYREYSQTEVDQLRQIKLMRKLGLPLEEIRRMQSGTLTVPDGMRRHLVTLERESRNLEHARAMCSQLMEEETPLSALDAEQWLGQMELLEQQGAIFQNRQQGDVRVKYVAPVLIAALMVLLMGGLMGLIAWSLWARPQDVPPLPMTLVLMGLPLVVILGVLLALVQRIQEIGKGEDDDAKQY
ncbi:MAG: MerR family transcriptional regulator [Oscillospiraceae bacterium]|nr:MerR family transcriptional regulator [Oscillospiraceae bacterium]